MGEEEVVSRFRRRKTGEEERVLLESTVPKNTQHNAKWALKVFEEWQSSRTDETPKQLSSCSELNLTKIRDLSTPLKEKNGESLNLWSSRFC